MHPAVNRTALSVALSSRSILCICCIMVSDSRKDRIGDDGGGVVAVKVVVQFVRGRQFEVGGVGLGLDTNDGVLVESQ